MLNPDLHLNKKIFDKDVEQVPIRKGFGEGLLSAGEQNQRVVGLCADLTESTQMHFFAEKFPQRFIEMGVAEQNMASVASGLAAMGKIPFISSYAMFSPGRNWEQIRTTICYNNRPVKIAGSHAGVSVGPDGGTHQALEDLAIARVLPRMVVISPCDAIEARKATEASAVTNTPVYLRLAREKTPVMTTNETPFEIGKAQIFWQGNKPRVGIIATGALLYQALLAAKELEEKGIAVEVMNLSTIKPLDKKAIVALANRAKAIVTVEEHQVAGGMGSAVAECLAEHKPVPMRFVGVHDQFGQSGKPEELLKHYGMDKDAIIKAVKELV
ncbi:MAG: Transketolase, central region [Parcubacteria group bacterium GW2011_GWB1_49_7]|uniref:Transketolase n=1 Tax=Candidatus Zambryskibacteria bacterium RIFCSPHIGHO2_01_FULL_46_25 TaxID=1802738 RepID=A0A1G2SZN1_9BACT|nr:MAG: Transketolase, central region [Parcubacteria group bacterium GW2011_GWA1_47_10]KKW09773.1 MAG: Transketolase, central region [Parcubacteria group bacterium GW2011_GWB1_49_7]OHA90312.1 MAG: transketolase [Candidatus Zambryskibacteria bacterium RIFCSPHIGHO2_01_FULL_46_25]OHB06853.1 MAG: transketolase [Candidatus Zambryskibacteria bacterium RIFCSPLOWO2_01_FULL_48_25]